MGDAPESSSAALERYLLARLEGLSISIPSDDVEYMARFVEEEGLEREEKIEGVRGMLEGFVEEPPDGVDDAMGRVVDEWDRLKAEEEARGDDDGSDSDSDSSTPAPHPKTGILSTLTPAELAAAQKAALIRQYAYLDATDEEIALVEGRDPNAPPPKGAGGGGGSKEAEERRKMIEDALKLDAKKKKHRKKREVDLLAPNLNREKVAYAAQMEREAARRSASEKRERDKAALEKQRADAAKAKADKQKKAAKQERRA